jgi:hypothetical protein
MAYCVKETWLKKAKAVGVNEKDCELIKTAFVYP